MTRRLLAPLAALLLAAPLAAQVGHLPDQSPYEDLAGRLGLTLGVGLINPASDPAGIGPGPGWLLHGRADYRVAGPLWSFARMGYAPGLERTIKDPEVSGPRRVVGTVDEPLWFSDVGLAMNLTGNKSWRGLAPRVSGSLGIASTFKSAYDLGGYRFGTKFILSYGIGARYATRSGWDLSADLTRFYWKMSYPDIYGGDGSATDESIMGTRPLGPWTANAVLTVGVTRYLWR